jgi:hypothetical protein
MRALGDEVAGEDEVVGFGAERKFVEERYH